MPRPKPPIPTVQVGFRLEQDLVDAIDAYAEELSRRAAGATITRVEALRLILRRGLKALAEDEKQIGEALERMSEAYQKAGGVIGGPLPPDRTVEERIKADEEYWDSLSPEQQQELIDDQQDFRAEYEAEERFRETLRWHREVAEKRRAQRAARKAAKANPTTPPTKSKK